MTNFWKDLVIYFIIVLITLFMGGCIGISLVQHGYISVDIPSSSSVEKNPNI